MMGQTMILGRFDAGVIAATSIAGMLHNMMYIAMNGFSSAVGIITGKTVGAGRIDKIRDLQDSSGGNPVPTERYTCASSTATSDTCIPLASDKKPSALSRSGATYMIRYAPFLARA